MKRAAEKELGLEPVLEEHRQLREMIERLRHDLSEGAIASLATNLIELQQQLESHFAYEERGGYFREAVRKRPYLAPQTERLLREHREFLEQLKELGSLAAAACAAESWQHIRVTYESFRQRFLDHEQAEDRLLWEVFGTDTGAGD